uniref:Uncharacterized protein n=1 Tax=Toxoplasma gondii COUG TaxID=1074873 RepID=A0A2G8Y6V2_TOXGO|nr:hypothetical protein TGCOUG_243310 [Toxoplasma gondii COUG]
MPCSSNDTGAGASWVDTLSPASFVVSSAPYSTISSRGQSSNTNANGQLQAASQAASLLASSHPIQEALRRAPVPRVYAQPSVLVRSSPLGAAHAVKCAESPPDAPSLNGYASSPSSGPAGSQRDVYSNPPPNGTPTLNPPPVTEALRSRRFRETAVQDEDAENWKLERSQEEAPVSAGACMPQGWVLSLPANSARRRSDSGVSDESHGTGESEEGGGVLFFTPISSPVKIRSFASSGPSSTIPEQRMAFENDVSGSGRREPLVASQPLPPISKGSDSGPVDWTAMCSRTYTPKLGLLQRCCEETDPRNEDENDDSDTTLSSLPESTGVPCRSGRPFSGERARVTRRSERRGASSGVYRHPGKGASRFAIRHPCQRPPCWKRKTKTVERCLQGAWPRDFLEDPSEVVRSSRDQRAPHFSQLEKTRLTVPREGGEQTGEAASGLTGKERQEGGMAEFRSSRNRARPRRSSSVPTSPQEGEAPDTVYAKKTATFDRRSLPFTSVARQFSFWERHERVDRFAENKQQTCGDSVDLDNRSEEGSPLFVSPVMECLLDPEEPSAARAFPALGPSAQDLSAAAFPVSTPGRAVAPRETPDRGSLSGCSRVSQETGAAGDSFVEGAQLEKRGGRHVLDFFTPTGLEGEKGESRLEPEWSQETGGRRSDEAREGHRRRSLGPGGWEKFEEEDSEDSEASCQRVKRALLSRETPQGSFLKQGQGQIHSAKKGQSKEGTETILRRSEETDSTDRRSLSGLDLIQGPSLKTMSWNALAEATSDEEIDNEDRRLAKRRRFSLSTLEPQSSSEEDTVSIERTIGPRSTSPPHARVGPVAAPPAPAVPSASLASQSSLCASSFPSSSSFSSSLSSSSLSPLPHIPRMPRSGKEEAAIAALLAAPPPPPPPLARLLRKRKRQSTGGVARRMLFHGPGFAGPGLPSADEATLVNSLGTALTAEETQELRQREEAERVRHQMLERKRKEEEARLAAEMARQKSEAETAAAEKAAKATEEVGSGSKAEKPAAVQSGPSSQGPQFVFGANRQAGDSCGSANQPPAPQATRSLGEGALNVSPSDGPASFSQADSGGGTPATEKPSTSASRAGGSGPSPLLAPGQRRPRLTIVRPSANSGNQGATLGGKNAFGATAGNGSSSGFTGAGPAVSPKPPGETGGAGPGIGGAAGPAGGPAGPGRSAFWGGAGAQGQHLGSNSEPAANGLLPGFGTSGLGVAGPGAPLAFGAGIASGPQDAGPGAPAGANPFAFQRGGRTARGTRGRGSRRR